MKRLLCRLFGHSDRWITTYAGRPVGMYWVCHRCGYAERYEADPLTDEEWRAFAEGAGFDLDGDA